MLHWKMKGWLAIVLLSGSLNVLAEGMKWGYVNAGRVYSESKAAQSIEANLQKEFAQRQQTMHRLENENEQLIHQLRSNEANAAQRQKWENQLTHNRMLLAKFMEEYNFRRSEEFAALQHNANVIIQRIAEQEHFDLIVQEAVFVKAQYDITDRVIKLLDGGK